MGIFSKLFGAEKEKCQNHPQKNAISVCVSCKRHFCADCLTEIMDNYLCGSEICKNFVEEKTKQVMNNIIASTARSLADEIINLFDNELASQEIFNTLAIYMEMVFICIHEIMDIASHNLDEDEKFIFMSEIYGGIRDVLAKRCSSQIDLLEFQTHFDDTFKQRRMEYLNFIGLNPGSSWSEDLLYMSFGKKIADILGREVDLETDANIQTLFITVSLPIPFVKTHLEVIKEKKNISHDLIKKSHV